MMVKFTIDEIISDRDNLQAIINLIQEVKSKNLEARKITVRQFNEITAVQYEIQREINRLNVGLINTKLTEITVGENSPAAKISASIDQLQKAIEELEEVSRFLNTVADVINGLSQVIGVLVSAGLVPV